MVAAAVPSENRWMTIFPAPASTFSLNVRTRFAPTGTLVALLTGLVADSVGGVVAGGADGSHPRASMTLMSFAETGSTTPLGTNARKASGPTEAAQSPRSPE